MLKIIYNPAYSRNMSASILIPVNNCIKKEQAVATLGLVSVMETDIVDIVLSHLPDTHLTHQQFTNLMRSHVNEMIQEVTSSR